MQRDFKYSINWSLAHQLAIDFPSEPTTIWDNVQLRDPPPRINTVV